MDVRFTKEQEARLAYVASRTGRNPDELVQEAVNQLLSENTRFLEAVEKGFASLDRGEFIAHEEMGKRLERIFRS
jgi:predicted transcriptional regulator